MIKSKILYSFLAINVWYSFNNCDFFLVQDALKDFACAIPDVFFCTGTSYVLLTASYLIKNCIKKESPRNTFLSALKPSIIIGCSIPCIPLLLYIKGMVPRLNKNKDAHIFLKAKVGSYLAGIGAAAYILLEINDRLIKKYGNNQKTEAA